MKRAASAISLVIDGELVNAVEEGRTIYDNIRKFVHYLLATNAGEVLLINRKGCAILGRSEVDLLGADWFARAMGIQWSSL